MKMQLVTWLPWEEGNNSSPGMPTSPKDECGATHILVPTSQALGSRDLQGARSMSQFMLAAILRK